MFSIPAIDDRTEQSLLEFINAWVSGNNEITTDLTLLDQAFNFALPRTIFLKSLPNGAVVMDVGAGDGSLVNYKLWPFFERTDLEMHALSLDKGKNFDSYDSYEIKNFETDPDIFPGMKFDAMVCCHFLEHMHDPAGAIDFFSQKIQPGGRLYLEWPHPVTKKFPSCNALVDTGASITTLNFFDDSTHIEAWPGDHVIALLEQAGFSIETAGRIHLPWIGEQMKNHAKRANDTIRMTIGSWAALGWSQYIIASRR